MALKLAFRIHSPVLWTQYIVINDSTSYCKAAVVRDLICCLCNGISTAGEILVGNELGAGNLSKGKLYGDRLMIMSFICGIISTIIMLLVTPFIMHFVKFSEGASSYLMGMMVIMSIYMIGRAVNTIVINGIFAAGGDTMFDMYSLAVVMWCHWQH